MQWRTRACRTTRFQGERLLHPHLIGRLLRYGRIGSVISLLFIATSATAGFVYGTVTIAGKAAEANTKLEIVREGRVVGMLTVKTGGGYNIFLAPGKYTVICPDRREISIDALSGPLIFDINC